MTDATWNGKTTEVRHIELPHVPQHLREVGPTYVERFMLNIRSPKFVGMLWGIAIVTGVEGIWETISNFNF